MFLFTEQAQREAIAEYVVEGNSAQMDDPAFVAELRDWLRFDPNKAVAKGDGLFSACSGNPVAPEWIGSRLFELFFTKRPRMRNIGITSDPPPGLPSSPGTRLIHSIGSMWGEALNALRFRRQLLVSGMHTSISQSRCRRFVQSSPAGLGLRTLAPISLFGLAALLFCPCRCDDPLKT